MQEAPYHEIRVGRGPAFELRTEDLPGVAQTIDEEDEELQGERDASNIAGGADGRTRAHTLYCTYSSRWGTTGEPTRQRYDRDPLCSREHSAHTHTPHLGSQSLLSRSQSRTDCA